MRDSHRSLGVVGTGSHTQSPRSRSAALAATHQVGSAARKIDPLVDPDGETDKKRGRQGTRAQSESAASADEDRVLIERSRFGDQQAFAELVAKYRQRCICIARKFVFDRESARDVAQDAFLRLYKSLDRYDPEQRFYTWFYRIVVHLAIDHVRRNKNKPQRLGEREDVGYGDRQAPHGVSGADHRVESPHERVEKEETREQIEMVLERIPGKYRVLLVLRDLEGFTSKEISDIAGWNHATVRWRLHRARKLFKEAWEAAGLDA